MNEFRPAHVIEADAALAVSVCDGDEDAVRELVDRFGGLVFTVAYQVLDNRAAAEDVAQQTFIQAWRRADSFEPGRDFAPWLATIARRLAIDELRRDRRRPSTALDAADPADTSLVTLPPSAEQIETVWAVRDAIESLDDSSRRIVRLQHVHGHTHAEIADQLGIPIGTVKSRAHRAHRRLARRLRRFRPDESSEDREPIDADARTEGRDSR
ncbi:MAG: sigma-70 family RNA polymerase sigma factor [Acidimicrobiia bacterium]|nr:sigma-70 family RNA polymerase sigma factor [Acidimicrobiia bacterium]